MVDTVFISSTYDDLRDHRAAVINTLLKHRFLPLAMEFSSTRPQEPLEACLDDVAAADFFVGIYAWRYGFVPPESTTSITEQELLKAQTLGTPVFCFLVDKSYEWPDAFRQAEGAPQLEALKRRIGVLYELDSRSFTTPDTLALNVLGALAQWRERKLAAPPVSPERETLLLLLDKVEHFWIDRVLRPAVPYGWRLRIEREERPEDVGRFVVEDWRPEMADGGTGEPLYDFLQRQDRKLLVLGEPGSGKTIALLELARGLARRARKEPSSPVPVVFNLASWQGGGRRLDDWMAQELHKRYDADEEVAKEWIKHNQILPLLDGLDEAASDARPDAVEATNAYLTDKGLKNPGIAVACHSQVYRELRGRRLRLDTAVVLRPLTSAQVDRHLAGAGPAFSGLRAALAKDAGLRELASTPLMVYLLKKTFEGAEELPPGLTKDGTVSVWEAFVSRMLESRKQLPWSLVDDEESRRWRIWRPWGRSGEGPSARPPSKDRFSLQETRRSLAWLAQGMAQHDRALFQIERLQPAWLPTHRNIFGSLPHTLYSLLYHMAGGVLLTLPLAIWTGRADFAGAGLLAGSLVGALETPRLMAPRAGEARAILRRALFRTLYLGGLTGLLVFLLGWPWLRITGASSNSLRASALLVGLLSGAVFGSRGAVRSGNWDIRVADKLRWRGWSRRGSLLGAGYALLASLAFWGLYLVSGSRTGFGPGFWIPFSAAASLLGAAVFGAFGGLGRRIIAKKSRPNQGTWRALGNAGFIALLAALLAISGLELMLAVLHIAQAVFEGETLSPANAGNALALLKTGAALGFWAGLAYSGLDFVQHFSLRLVLGIWKLVPCRLVPFLNHAVERGLLQRPGGSYKFFHHLLQDHFAKSYGSPDRTP